MNDRNETNHTVLRFQDTADLFAEAAAKVVEIAKSAVEARDRFLFVLAGGETPKSLYSILAQERSGASVPWQKTHVFWGDERAVPPDDPQSNFGMAAEHLLHAIPVPQENVHRIKGELGAAAAARAYARELQEMADQGLAWPSFDLVLLGLGRDGHTASLFPGSTHPSRSAQATLAVTGSYERRPTSRITLTPPVFNSARNIYFLVTGQEKADILSNVFDRNKSAVRFPARRINPPHGQVTWFVDSAAASKLGNQPVNI